MSPAVGHHEYKSSRPQSGTPHPHSHHPNLAPVPSSAFAATIYTGLEGLQLTFLGWMEINAWGCGKVLPHFALCPIPTT